MLKIIIPLAGSSELFYNAGFHYPKPLVEISGKTMIEKVLENPKMINSKHQFIFLVKEEDVINYHIDNTLRLLSPSCEVILVKNSTKGSLCSVLLSVDYLKSDDSVLVLNGDQVIDFDFNEFLNFWIESNADCGLVTFNSVHPRWSYARIDENNLVVQTAEKNPISNHAIAGYYYFKSSNEFLEASFKSIKDDSHFNNLYYISPVVNQYILLNRKVVAFNISSKLYHSFYSPQLLNDYERQNLSFLEYGNI